MALAVKAMNAGARVKLSCPRPEMLGFAAVGCGSRAIGVATSSSRLMDAQCAGRRRRQQRSALRLHCLQKRPSSPVLLPELACDAGLWPELAPQRGEIATDVVRSYDLTLSPSVLGRLLPGELVCGMDFRSLGRMRKDGEKQNWVSKMGPKQPKNHAQSAENIPVMTSAAAAESAVTPKQQRQGNTQGGRSTLPPASFMADRQQQKAVSVGERARALASPRDTPSERCPMTMIVEQNEKTQVSLAYHFRNMRSLAARRHWADPFYRHRVLEARRRTLNRKRRVAAALARAESNQSTPQTGEPEPTTGVSTESPKKVVTKQVLRRSRRAGPVESITLVDERRAKELIAYAQSNAKRAQKHRQLQADRIGWMQQRLAAGAELRQRLLDPAYRADLQRHRSEIAALRHAKNHRHVE